MDSFLGQLVDPLQKFLLAFDQNGPRTLPAPILAGPPAELSALLGRHTVNTVLALFTASNHPPFVQIALGAPAVGFAAFAAEQIERAWNHRFGTLERFQSPSQVAVGLPELFAQS